MNGEKLHTFRRRFWLHPGTPWGRNIDLTLPGDALVKIAKMTLVTEESLANHTLNQYLGRLFEYIDPNGNGQGILVGRRRGQKLLGFGLQLCPECVQSNHIAYFRRWWKVAYFVACPLHNRLLIDACPHCQRPLAYHLADFGKTLLPERIPTSFCSSCGYRWAGATVMDNDLLPAAFVEWQGQLLEALETGWFNNNQTAPVYALSFFEGLRTLIRLIAADGHCAQLRHIIAKEIGTLPLGVVHGGSRNIFGNLRLGDRLYLLHYVFWLLQEWPERFIWATKTAKLTFSYIDHYRNRPIFPYWVASVAELTRDYQHSRISFEEKESVKHFLEKHRLPTNANQVNRWLGRWYVSRHKHDAK